MDSLSASDPHLKPGNSIYLIWEEAMSAGSSEMLSLLQELALMKEMDAKYEGGAKGAAETAEFENRKHRRREICEQIVALGGTVS
jgi:hypothetical protein